MRKIWDGSKLVQLQYARRMTCKQIAEKLGHVRPVVSWWRRGLEPTPEQVKALAKLLRAKPDDFFVEVDCEK